MGINYVTRIVIILKTIIHAEVVLCPTKQNLYKSKYNRVPVVTVNCQGDLAYEDSELEYPDC